MTPAAVLNEADARGCLSMAPAQRKREPILGRGLASREVDHINRAGTFGGRPHARFGSLGRQIERMPSARWRTAPSRCGILEPSRWRNVSNTNGIVEF